MNILLAVALIAEIHQTEPRQVTAVELLKLRNSGRSPEAVVQKVTLPKSDAIDRIVRFEDVEPGRYVVMALGDAPSQRVGTRVDVLDFELPPLHVQLSPYTLTLRTPAKSAVILRQQEAFWEARVTTDVEGEATLELWQPGPLTALVDAPGSIPFRARKTIQETIDTEWSIELPEQEVVGTVVDAVTGAPVPHAKLALRMKAIDGSELAVSVDADRDGTFRFAPVVAGEHELQAAAADYPVARITYAFGEDDETRSVTIKLERQPQTRLTATDAQGKPLIAAGVHVFRGETRVAFTKTGTDGTAPIFIPEGEVRDVYIVPRDGSFGVARVTSGTPEARVAIMNGTSRIVVRAAPRVMAEVRWNGFILPDEVMMALVARGSKIFSGEEGRIVLQQMPVGTYEISAGGKTVRVSAVAGENVVN